jgi:hypothetical protein
MLASPATPEGPCCGRCGWWRAPEAGRAFGYCRTLVVVTERIGGGPERGVVLPRYEAEQRGYPWEALSTRAGFAGCHAFVQKAVAA